MKGKRTGELRVMNSANILILFAALRVPDAASHASLDPLEIDLASLAFSQGHDAASEGRSEPLGQSSIEVSNSWIGGGGHMSSFRMNRREFIGAIGAAAFAAVANTRAAESPLVAPSGMQKRAIPSSGEQLPVIGMGTSGTFDVGATEAERAPLVEVLRLLFEGGGSLIDTAPSYGRAETVIGDLLQQGDWRQRAFLATKISAGAGAGARAQWNGSLARLRSDKVDLLQVHNLVDWRENLAFLRELKQAGQVRYIGVTHYLDHAHDELARIVEAERIDFVQVNYSAATRSAEKRLLPLCKERGVAVLVNRAFEDGRLFDTVHGREVPAWAAEIDCRSWAQLFLKFVLANPAVTAVIPATSKARHMLDNLGAGVGAVADAKYQDRIAALVS